jgi:GalNAc-alpha-(1->4)-GalNAc-alpha-(1->3)-diNAcBac-PP-undecaprenol alpha-1,4-N-acetyl-D-galactosaminyltransferase
MQRIKELKYNKLCLLIHSLQPGGMERVMSELSTYFCQKKGISVHLVLYGRNPVIFYTVAENLIIHQPQVKFNDKYRFIYTLKRFIFLRRTIKTIDPDSVLSFGEYWNSFVLLVLLGLKYPIFVSDRCSPTKSLGFVHDRLRRWLYPKASGIIVQTHHAKEIYHCFIEPSLIKVIGNPIRRIDEKQGVPKENIVLTVGRLIPSKNHARLIESFVHLNKPDWKLVIIGGNALKMNIIEDLKALISILGAEENVILTGSIQDVDFYYKRSKIFVLTSQSEGFPNVIGEAMSAGLPVVAFDCIAGPSELITDGRDGYLVPLFDFQMLEERLLILMNDSELRKNLGSEAAKSIKRFSVDNIGEEYFSLLTTAN